MFAGTYIYIYIYIGRFRMGVRALEIDEEEILSKKC